MIDESIKCTYKFIVTPVEIIHKTSKSKPLEKKTLLVKLCNNTIKFNNLNESISMIIDVIYSKVLQKFCPLKAIIKIYDVLEGGKQVIACVGAFQTQDLLNSNRTQQLIEKQIGVYIVKMKVEIQAIEGIGNIEMKKSGSQFNSADSMEKSLQKISSFQKHPTMNEDNLTVEEPMEEIRASKFSKKIQPMEEYELTRQQNEKSFQNLSFSCSEILDELKKRQIEILGEELIEQRRKTKMQEEIIQKLMLKVQGLKKKTKIYEVYLKKCQKEYEDFIKSLEEDEKGQYIFELNEKKSTLTLKYKKGYDFEKVFLKFLYFISRQTTGKSFQKNEINEINLLMNKIDIVYKEKQNLEQVNQQRQAQNRNLKDNISQLSLKLKEKQLLITRKNDKIMKLQKRIQDLKEIEQENSFLKQKNFQFEEALRQKELEEENFKEIEERMNLELEDIENEKFNLFRKVTNQQFKIDQLQQDLAEKQQIIESLKEKQKKLQQLSEAENKVLIQNQGIHENDLSPSEN